MNNQDAELDHLTVTEDSGLTRAGFFGFQNLEILVAIMGLIGTACILFLLNLRLYQHLNLKNVQKEPYLILIEKFPIFFEP